MSTTVVNVRKDLYDNHVLNVDAAAVFADDNIQVEFLRGTIASSSPLNFKNTSFYFAPAHWWNDASETQPANGFIGTQSSGIFKLPCIGSMMANSNSVGLKSHINISSNWLMFCPGSNSNSNTGGDNVNQLLIKAVPKSQKKITGYTIYFYDDVEGTGIGITSGDNNNVHYARQVLSMATTPPSWTEPAAIIDSYSGVKRYDKVDIEITGNDYIYINIDDNSSVGQDAALIRLDFTVEGEGLAPPTVNFPGSPALIQSATVDITSLGTGASGWQYSIDAGVNFSDGTGTSFSLLAGTYAINQIQVRNGDGTGNNWSTTKNNLSQIEVIFSSPTVNFPASGDNGIVNITLGNSATAWQYSIDAGVSFSDGAGTSFSLPAGTYAQNQIQVHNGDGTNWSATENNGSGIVISAPPTPPPEPVSTTETVDIRKSYYPESKVNSTSNSLFNKVYSQKLLTSVDKIERTPLELKKNKSVEQYHNGTQDRLLRIKSKAMNNK